MSTAVVGIRLEAAMQAWALAARGTHRDCYARPTKSGVIGLVANALGRDFADPIGDLAALRFGVRVDRPGQLEIDYHTSGGGRHQALPREVVWSAGAGDPTDPAFLVYETVKNPTPGPGWNMKGGSGDTYVTIDRYLADASFLAALEGPSALIAQIGEALLSPARAVFLGRRAYGPATSLLEGVREASIEELFADTVEEAAERTGNAVFDAYVEPRHGARGNVISDQPVSFDGPIRRSARFENQYTLTAAAAADRRDVGGPVASPDRDDVFDTAFAERN